MISVVIPTFNYGKFLAEAIESVINQTYADWEMVVIDDASTDNTSIIINKYHNIQIRYFKNIVNLGVDKTVNLGIKYARGEYLCLLSADDWLPDNSLEVRLNQLLADGASAVHGGLTRIEKGERTFIAPANTVDKGALRKFLQGQKPKNEGINNATFLWKKEILNKINRDISANNYHHSDYETALKTIIQSNTTITKTNTYFYRIHDKSLLEQAKAREGWEVSRQDLEKKYLGYLLSLAYLPEIQPVSPFLSSI
jgi:teichuronic acid biosynthesis glycosyltransferase TuaG